MMRNIYLEGEMGHKFGTGFSMNAPTIKDVFACLDANDSSFKSYLVECANNEIGFTIDIAGNQIDYNEELLMPFNEGDITITPVPAGSKGIGKIIKAVIIVYITFKMGGFGFIQGMSTATSFAAVAKGFAALVALGVATSLAMAGIMEMFAPDPSTDKDGESSYLFNGSAQNIVEGDPVPVLYGKLRVPGQPVGFEMAGVNMGVNSPYISRRGGSGAPETTSGSTTTVQR